MSSAAYDEDTTVSQVNAQVAEVITRLREIVASTAGLDREAQQATSHTALIEILLTSLLVLVFCAYVAKCSPSHLCAPPITPSLCTSLSCSLD
jgi:hypothetical protein